MPRNTRNFYVVANAGGGKPVSAGPKGRNGGLQSTLTVREQGVISDVSIDTICTETDGFLTVRLYENSSKGSELLYQRTFQR